MTGEKDAVSTLLVLGEKEFVLSASPGRVLFNYNREEASFVQKLTVTLDERHELHQEKTSSIESAAVPIILSNPSTTRFELNQVSPYEASSSFEFLLSCSSPRTFIIKFKPPEVSESDFVWDNFQDQLVIHTRLSRLVIPLEAWKNEALVSPLGHDKNSLFPASLSSVKAPPLKRFAAIERAGEQQHQRLSPSKGSEPTKSASLSMLEDYNRLDALSTPRTPQAPQTGSLPSLSCPASGELQILSSHRSLVDLLPFTEVTAVKSQHEASEVILKLRRRRTARTTAKASNTTFTSVADTELCPETVVLDAKTKAELEAFNDLVCAAKDHVLQQAAKAKTELAYYQQLRPTPPSIAETPASILGLNSAVQTPRKPRQMSALAKRPSKLPSLVRPSSGEDTASILVNNQEISPVGDGPGRRRVFALQRVKSLSPVLNNPSKLMTIGKPKMNSNQQDTDSELSDFDDSDPEVDDAPVMPDDLSGVATLEAEP